MRPPLPESCTSPESICSKSVSNAPEAARSAAEIGVSRVEDGTVFRLESIDESSDSDFRLEFEKDNARNPSYPPAYTDYLIRPVSEDPPCRGVLAGSSLRTRPGDRQS